MVHPSAKILAEGGPIVIGDGNLIQEKAVILNKFVYSTYIASINVEIRFHRKRDDETKEMVIGNGNVFSIASRILNSYII